MGIYDLKLAEKELNEPSHYFVYTGEIDKTKHIFVICRKCFCFLLKLMNYENKFSIKVRKQI